MAKLQTTEKMCQDMVKLMGDEGTVRAETAHDALEAHKTLRELRGLLKLPACDDRMWRHTIRGLIGDD